MEKQMAKEGLSTQTVTSTKANGKMIKPMERESTGILMAPFTRVIGMKTNNTEKAKRLGQINLNTMEIS